MSCFFPDCLVDPKTCACFPQAMPPDVRAIARDVVPVTCPDRRKLAEYLQACGMDQMEYVGKVRHG